MLSSVMWTVIQQADNILLGAFLRTESVGLYDASFLLAKLVLTTLGAFGFLFMPMFSRLDADGDADGMDELYRTSTKWVVSLTLPIFLVLLLFPEAILGGLFGPEYAAGATALQILTLGFFVHALSGLAGNAIVSIGRTRTILLANVCVALLNVTGNVLLIPRIGIEGAAVASALSYLALNAGYLWVLRGYGISPLSRELSGSVATTAVLVVPPCLLLQYTSGVTFGMATAVFVAVLGTHGIVYLLVGASSADLEIIEAAERRTNLNLTILKQVVGD
jgi:O-antigen/teichoic acid export membrane protein